MLKLLKYLQINHNMAFLVTTLNEAKNAIFYYLIVLVILLMGFFLFTYCAFGSNVEKFSTLNLGIMTLMEMFIGKFDYQELKAGDPILAPFFFIIYMLIFTFILINIFIALLENAYNTVKKSEIGLAKSNINYFKAIMEWFIYKCRNKSLKKTQNEIKLSKTHV